MACRALSSPGLFASKGLRIAQYQKRMSMCNPSVPDWSSCKVISNRREAEGLRFVEIEVSPALSALYTSPGQYVKIKLGEGKPGFYAIASPPDLRPVLQFLIKETDSNAYIAKSQSGTSLDLSAPQGKGFTITESFDKYKYEFPTTNVLLLATGSGIAPIAAAIDYPHLGLRKIGPNSLFERKATLYIGARSEDHLPFTSKFSQWEDKGVKIVPVLSKPSNSWTGNTGYVQEVLKSQGVQVPRNTGALLVGQRGMVDNVKELLLDAGVFEGRICLNF